MASSFAGGAPPPPYPGLAVPKSKFAMSGGAGRAAPGGHKAWSKGEPLTWDVVKTRCTKESLWVVVSGGVYDVTHFRVHPGGMQILLQHGGQDATVQFDRYHSRRAREQLAEFYLGDVVNDAGSLLTVGYAAPKQAKPKRPAPGGYAHSYPPRPATTASSGPPPVALHVPTVAVTAPSIAVDVPTFEVSAPAVPELSVAPAPVVAPDENAAAVCVSSAGAARETVVFTLRVGVGWAATPLCGHVRLFTPDGASRRYTPIADREGLADGDRTLEFVVKRYADGEVSPWLHGLAAGASLRMTGPFPPPREVLPHVGDDMLRDAGVWVLVAGGTGVAPFVPLLARLSEVNGGCACDVYFVWANRRACDVPRAVRENLVAAHGGRVCLRLHLFYSEEEEEEAVADTGITSATAGRVTHAALQALLPPPPPLAAVGALVCGPPSFNGDVQAALRELGYEAAVLD
eukprot:TRINITY_DN12951_c0_g2_i1.p1 TRINITY_DN12951_c0_g2~~TRINITY_DN12951_c0_g2_i1.p1  ORF type:complete len:510 (+),score=95.52 TRINITY_DN12951_c0_g2_i1:154-1530(+)